MSTNPMFRERMGPVRATSSTWIVALLAVIIAGAALRIISMRRESLVGDELFTYAVASGSFHSGLRMVLQDNVHPPLHYLLAAAWTRVVAPGVGGLRWLSILFGLATVALTAVVGVRVLGDGRAALLAAALTAFSDLEITVSHYGRSYAMFATLALVLVLAVWEALERPDRPWRWIAFAAAVTLLVYTHYVGWFYVLATFPAVLAARRWRDLLRWSGAVVAAGALFLPWILAVRAHLQEAQGLQARLAWGPTPSLETLPNLLARFTGLPADAAGGWTALAVGGALTAGAFLLRERPVSPQVLSRRVGLVLLTAAAILPPLVLLILSLPPIALPAWGIRHLVPAMAPWALLLGAGVLALRRKSRTGAGALGLVLIAAQLVPTIQNTTTHHRFTPFADIAEFVRAERGPGDAAYCADPYYLAMVNRYLPRTEPVLELPDDVGRLPSRAWLIFCPDHGSNRVLWERLARGGFTVRRTRSFPRMAGDDYDTTVVLVARRGSPGSRASPSDVPED